MDRAEAAGLSAAVVGHVIVFGLLSLSLTRKPVPPPISDPVEVQLVEDVGLRSAQPKPATEDPAPSFAPDVAPPEPAAAPAPQPAPKVKPIIKAAPVPAVAKKPEPKSTPLPAPKAAAAKPTAKPSHLATDIALAAATTPARPKGARLSANFLDGVSDKPSTSSSNTPKAATIDSKAIASISEALRRQVQPCADRALNPGPGASHITTKLTLHFNKDGTLANQPQMTSQTGIDDENRRYAQRVKELAVAAYVQCSPYHLPPELYADSANRGWNNISATFTLRPDGQ